MKRRWVVGGLALAAVGVTCGGDGGTFSSGIDSGAQLGSLSPADAQKLCDSLNSWMRDTLSAELKEASCRTAGLFATGFTSGTAAQKEAACTTAYNECMKKPAEQTGTTTCEKPSAACTATVGELEACINEVGPLMKQAVGSIPNCAQAAAGTQPQEPPNLQPPAACKTVESKCGDLPVPSFPTGFGD